MFFHLKQLVSVLSDPLAFVTLLAIAGAACRLIGRRRTGNAAIAAAILTAYASSVEVVSGALIRPLETRYPAIGDGDPLPDVAYVVVLGHDYFADVEEDAIVVLPGALDTAGEARDVRQFLGDSPFLLVTSASHIPRAMRLMERAGAKPIPAPTGHRTEHHPEGTLRWRSFVPAAGNLEATDTALHEYLGLAAIAMSLGEPATLD